MTGHAVRVLRMGITGLIRGVGLQRRACHASMQRRTGLLEAGRVRSRTGPLQGQAEQEQQGKQTGTHGGLIVEVRLPGHYRPEPPPAPRGISSPWNALIVASSSGATGIGRNAPTFDRPVLPSGRRPSKCPKGTSNSRIS